ncbi:MAG: DUF308 domain-containing protein [Methylotenera sp.]|nr:DUF308 domain-containing protein [Methylotenera sp.]
MASPRFDFTLAKNSILNVTNKESAKLLLGFSSLHTSSVMAMKGPDADCDDGGSCGNSADPLEFLVVLVILAGWWSTTLESIVSRLWFTALVGGLGLIFIFNSHKTFALIIGWLFLIATVLSWIFGEKELPASTPSINETSINIPKQASTPHQYSFDEGHHPCATEHATNDVGELNKEAMQAEVQQIKQLKLDAQQNPQTQTYKIHADNFTGQTAEQKQDTELEFKSTSVEVQRHIKPNLKGYTSTKAMPDFLQTKPKQKEKICPFCRGSINGQTRICGKCGTGFSIAPSGTYDEDEE